MGNNVGIFIFLFVNDLNIEAEWPESVITTDHRTHGVLHPTVKEIAFTLSQWLNKLLHRFPGRWTHTFRALPIYGNPLLALPDIASVLNGILIFFHQVVINRLANSCDADFIHLFEVTCCLQTRNSCIVLWGIWTDCRWCLLFGSCWSWWWYGKYLL